jgi:catechol 2,3-dioxygenase-like lactoylglutathione lyase family enzyme
MPDPNLGTLSQISRRVQSLDRARAFYRERLGLAELMVFPGLAFFAVGSLRLMLSETGKADEADILYFRVADIETAHRDLKARGVTFQHAPSVIHIHPDGSREWMAFFVDDEGRTLALASVEPASTPTSG